MASPLSSLPDQPTSLAFPSSSFLDPTSSQDSAYRSLEGWVGGGRVHPISTLSTQPVPGDPGKKPAALEPTPPPTPHVIRELGPRKRHTHLCLVSSSSLSPVRGYLPGTTDTRGWYPPWYHLWAPLVPKQIGSGWASLELICP